MRDHREGFENDGAFERKPCRRKLQYIGYDSWPEPTRSEMNAEGHGCFVPGEYTSHMISTVRRTPSRAIPMPGGR